MKRLREPQEVVDRGSPVPEQDPSSCHDESRQHPSKIFELEPIRADDSEDHLVAMRCTLPPHKVPVAFNSYSDYEAHYNTFHTHRCLECQKNFPSDHLLAVHIEECHDPLVTIRREKGEHTFSCFVEGCERKCLTHQKRRMHMIDKHMYPKNYFFAVTKEGIDGRRSLLVDGSHRRRRSSASIQPQKPNLSVSSSKGAQTADSASSGRDMSQPESDQRRPDGNDVTELADAMSALNFVPQSIRFGRGRPGFAKR
ncbi:hypothetical protein HIM_01751 [Hirsutella minnesotensis 3608]|nr:hypothetical protein HIM_01751 [Hirsutella minnesotensis 3608]